MDPDRSLQTHLRSAVHAMDQSSQRRGARQADDEKGSAEMLGDLMSGFFEQSRAMLDPTSKNIPPPQLRENLAQKLRAHVRVVCEDNVKLRLVEHRRARGGRVLLTVSINR